MNEISIEDRIRYFQMYVYSRRADLADEMRCQQAEIFIELHEAYSDILEELYDLFSEILKSKEPQCK